MKRALDDAGSAIPFPCWTLIVKEPLAIRGDAAASDDGQEASAGS